MFMFVLFHLNSVSKWLWLGFTFAFLSSEDQHALTNSDYTGIMLKQNISISTKNGEATGFLGDSRKIQGEWYFEM